MSQIIKLILFFFTLIFTAAIQIEPVKALNTTYTVCPVGCDFTLISDALLTPGLNNDTIRPTSAYVFDETQESFSINIPDTVTLSCEAGADTLGDESIGPYLIALNNDSTLSNCNIEYTQIFASSVTSNVNITDNIFFGTLRNQIAL